MPTHTKNKWLMTLVILLLLVNGVTIAMFWIGRGKEKLPPPPPPQEQGGSPANYLIRELGLDSQQQQRYMVLVKEHQQASAQLRRQIGEEKDRFFGLLRQSTAPDSVKKAAVAAASRQTEALDLLTFEHFQKVRAICTPAQQEKFDRIIQQVTAMMAGPKPGGPGGPPPPDYLRNGPGPKSKEGRRLPPEGHPPGDSMGHRPPSGDFPPDGPPPHRLPHGHRPPPPGGSPPEGHPPPPPLPE